jgi:hypothetical protein
MPPQFTEAVVADVPDLVAQPFIDAVVADVPVLCAAQELRFATDDVEAVEACLLSSQADTQIAQPPTDTAAHANTSSSFDFIWHLRRSTVRPGRAPYLLGVSAVAGSSLSPDLMRRVTEVQKRITTGPFDPVLTRPRRMSVNSTRSR